MRVALVHDYLTQRGGAERVVLALHRMFPQAPIYTSVYHPEGTFAELAQADVRPSFMQRLPHTGDRFRALLPLFALAFERVVIARDEVDLVISSSSGWAHGARFPGGRHICYCHNPARWLYQPDAYFAPGGPVPPWTRPLLGPVLAGLRQWDARAARRPTEYVANSHNVAGRIRQRYGRSAVVVPPPVEVDRFRALPRRGRDHYLVVARLLSYKRIDLAIRACNELGLPLIVVGDGPARDELAHIAGPTVRMAGRVSEAELDALYADARGLIQAGEEDFGIVPLEANAAGLPVVALARGGALETVVSQRTGILVPQPTVAAFRDALARCDAIEWNSERLREHADSFSEARFAARIRAVIDAGAREVDRHAA